MKWTVAITIVQETQEKSTFNPNLDLEGDAWLDWFMLECIHMPLIPDTQIEVEGEGGNDQEEKEEEGKGRNHIIVREKRSVMGF